MVCHWDAVPERVVEAGPMRAAWMDLGSAAGSVEVGLRRARIPAGAQSTPAHAHDAEEELCFILAGAGLSWQDGTTYEVRAGDALLHRAGGAAHTLVGGPGGLEMLMFGERRRAEVGRLPRAGVAWIGTTWTEAGHAPHPWERDADAGPVDVEEEPAPRPPGIVALADVPAEPRGRGDTAFVRRDLARALGSAHTGLRHLEVEPGALSGPPHCHTAEEELFVVIDGAGTLLLGDEEQPLRPGHVVARPAGTGVAHAFRGGPDGLTLLAYGDRRPDDITFYPRSSKVFLRGAGIVFRVEDVDYWDGEA
jgi:uncharacterized cupin superfamily protein